MGRVDWVWATPPSRDLRVLGEEFTAGRLPAGHECIKQSDSRSVWRTAEICGGVLLKHYRVRSKEALKACVQFGRAEREYRVMEAFCRLGIPTVRPLGFAERRTRGRLREAWFLGRLVPDALSLGEAVLAERDVTRRQRLVERALDAVLALHAHPFLHRDLHAGNLLVTSEGRILIIDLHSVWRVPLLTRGMRMENLARFLYSLRDAVSLDAAPEFLAYYAERRGEALDTIVRLGRAALLRFERDYVRGRSARCLRDSTEFTRETIPEGRVHRRREYAVDALRRDLADHAALFVARDGVALDGDGDGEREPELSARGEPSGGVVLGIAPRAQVFLTSGQDEARVIKIYRGRGVLGGLRARLGLGRARVAWKAARRCQVQDVPTPEALLLLESAGGGAVLVTRAVPGARSLRALAGLDMPPLPAEVRGPLAFALGHVVGRLARAGLRHADLSPKNVLVGEGQVRPARDLRVTSPPDLPDVQVIDLDGCRRTKPHDPAALARMLGQLGDLASWVTRSDRRRFALGFRQGAGRELTPDVLTEAARRLHERRERRARRVAARAALPRPAV